MALWAARDGPHLEVARLGAGRHSSCGEREQGERQCPPHELLPDAADGTQGRWSGLAGTGAAGNGRSPRVIARRTQGLLWAGESSARQLLIALAASAAMVPRPAGGAGRMFRTSEADASVVAAPSSV